MLKLLEAYTMMISIMYKNKEDDYGQQNGNRIESVRISYQTGRCTRKGAEHCSSKVEIIYEYNIINARSLLNILAASIPCGSQIELRCTGPNEKEDLDAMEEALKHLE